MDSTVMDAAARTTSPSGRVDRTDPDRDVFGLPEIEDPTKVAPRDARAVSKLFFDRLAVLEEGTHEHQYVRNTLIELNLSLVRFAASRFRNRAEPQEDLVQVGTIGLIKAIDRFDLTREVEFTTFAVPYIVGEIKRFFRDTSWAVHVPRRLQEFRLELAGAIDVLSSRLGRSPTTNELAEHMGVSAEEVVEGRIASNGYVAGSLEISASDDDSGGDLALADRLGGLDPALEKVEDIQALQPLLEELDARDRRILELRFGAEMTQSEIGEVLGISQMHVSRLLSRTLRALRTRMLAQD